MELRSEEAAARIYRILVALQKQGQELVDWSSSSSDFRSRIPGFSYMADSMELWVGGMARNQPPLIRGKVRYQQIMDFWIDQLQSNLRQGRLVLVGGGGGVVVNVGSESSSSSSAEPPVVTLVEWTPNGTIRYRLTLNLRVPIGGGGGSNNRNNSGEQIMRRIMKMMPNGSNGSNNPNKNNALSSSGQAPSPSASSSSPTMEDFVNFLWGGGGGGRNPLTPQEGGGGSSVSSNTGLGFLAPLQISLLSEFGLDPVSGEIVEQRILEGLVNGQPFLLPPLATSEGGGILGGWF